MILRTVLMVAALSLAASCSSEEDVVVDELPQVGPGNVCGDPDLWGETIGTVDGPGSCGIENAIRLTEVFGVRLSTAARIDCGTAQALKTWVETGVIPAVGDTGGGATSLRVVAHYSCRTRNNQPGARLSEHSFGRAIDIAGIGLADGTEISVLSGWNGTYATQLRQMWQAACGPFGTVLGPDGDRFHQDHFHFDTAVHGNGSFCR